MNVILIIASSFFVGALLAFIVVKLLNKNKRN